jgi:undecaprenyl diphosphate synthase
MNRLLTIRMDGSVSDYEYFSAALASAGNGGSSSSRIENESHSSVDHGYDLRQYGYYSIHDDNDNRSIFHGCSEAEATAKYGYDDDQVHPTLRRLLRLFYIEYYRNPLIFLSVALLCGILMGTLMGIRISRWHERKTVRSSSSSMANYGRQDDQVQDGHVQEEKEDHKDHEATTPTPPTPATESPAAEAPPPTLPRHIAIVMDGNRRYGRTHHCNGHAKGARQLGHVIEWVLEIPAVQELTLFCFSTENWHRDTAEVDYLFNTLLKDYMEQQLQQMVLDRHIQVRIQSTHWHLIPTNVQTQLRQLQESTAHFQFGSAVASCNLVLNLCISYGSRQEIVAACQRLVDRHVAEAVQRQRQRQPHIPQQQQHDCRITEADLVRELCVTSDPDLLIRTAGDQRLSNFLLWQCSYAELCFIDEPWPAVTRERFRQIVLDEYPRRQRRFGK